MTIGLLDSSCRENDVGDFLLHANTQFGALPNCCLDVKLLRRLDVKREEHKQKLNIIIYSSPPERMQCLCSIDNILCAFFCYQKNICSVARITFYIS